MTERYGRSNQSDAERGWDQNWQNPRQQQQFHDSEYRQTGGYDDTQRNRGWDAQQGGDYSSGGHREDRGYQREAFGRSSYADQGRFSSDRLREREDRDYQGTLRAGQYGNAYADRGYGDRGYADRGYVDRDRGYGYAPGGYGAERFSSFTGNDFGGRDFARGSNALYGGAYGNSYGRGEHRNDYSGWREYGESRGFLERAGDEIASWFGDEDAARRRRQDQNHSGRGPEGYTRSDERIREDVNDALTRDWAVDASKVSVKVQNGEVTLDGSVPSRTAKRKAEDCADGVSGVKHVQNNLRVQDHTAGTNTASGVTGTGTGTGTSAPGATTVDTTRTTR